MNSNAISVRGDEKQRKGIEEGQSIVKDVVDC